MSKGPYQILRRPVVTEKTARLDETQNQLVFEVDSRATKGQIREAVEKVFKVKVLEVRTMRMRGKPLRRGRLLTRRRNWKKAVITLREGDRIDFYESA